MKYIVLGDQYGILEGDNFIALGNDIQINTYIRDIDSEEFSINVSYYVGNTLCTEEIKINRNFINTLEDVGYLVNKKSEHHLKNYINQQLSEIEKPKLIHHHLGWTMKNHTLIFRGLQSIGSSEISDYTGEFDISCSVKKSDYVKAYNALIAGDIKMEFGIAMGLSGCMAAYLNTICSEAIDSLIFDIYGSSSTGKSTILDLAVSTCGNPYAKYGKESLRGTCSSTKNALIARLADNYGFFVGFDELGRLDSANISDILYQIADGTGKGRCDKSGSLKQTNKWMTSVGFTGEYSVLDIAEKKDGLLNRIFSFDGVCWTKDGEYSKEIKSFASKYYGIPVHVLAKYLTRQDRTEVISNYKSTIDRLEKIVPVPSQFMNRSATRMAIVILAAQYAGKAIGIDLHFDLIERFMLCSGFSHFRLEHEKAYSYFMSRYSDETVRFSNKYPTYDVRQTKEEKENKQLPNVSGALGYIEYKTEKDCYNNDEYYIDKIVIRADTFAEWMNAGKFKNINAILREWRKSGILICEKDRFADYKRLYNGGKLEKAYTIKFCDSNGSMNVFERLLVNELKLYTSSSTSKTEIEYGNKLISIISIGNLDQDYKMILKEQYLENKLDYKKLIVKYYHKCGPKTLTDVDGKTRKTCYIRDLSEIDKIEEEKNKANLLKKSAKSKKE